MVLLIIVAILCAVAIIYRTWDEYYDKVTMFAISLVVSLFTGGCFLLIVNDAGYEVHKSVRHQTYNQPIASLGDGQGIQGSFHGGIFVSYGQIGDTQQYSYYLRNANGSFNLMRRPADQSTIYTDTPPSRAYVRVTDKVTTCRPTWWLLCDPTSREAEFEHADFHIPAGSIANDFKLDGAN